MKKKLFFLLVIILSSGIVSAATKTATTGNWNPSAGSNTSFASVATTTSDSIIIPNGVTVTVTGIVTCGALNVQSGGAIIYSSSTSRQIAVVGGTGGNAGTVTIDGSITAANSNTQYMSWDGPTFTYGSAASFTFGGTTSSGDGGFRFTGNGSTYMTCNGKTIGPLRITSSGTVNIVGNVDFRGQGTAGPASSGVITLASTSTLNIPASSTVTISANNVTTVDMTVASGGKINLDGTINNKAGTYGSLAGSGALTVNNGGKYIHATSSQTLPIATWNTGSTIEATGFTAVTTPVNFGQAFYNFIWNCPNQSAGAALGGALTTINGDFTINDCGSVAGTIRDIRLFGNGNSGTVTVGGNLVINSNGQLAIINSGSNSTGAGVLTVSGNVTVSGKLDMTGSSANTASSSTLNLTGDLTINSTGSVVRTQSTPSTINFKKSSGTQNFSQNGGTISNSINWNFGTTSPATSPTVLLGSNISMGGNGVITVNSVLDCSTYSVALTGSPTFTNSGIIRTSADAPVLPSASLTSGTLEYYGGSSQVMISSNHTNVLVTGQPQSSSGSFSISGNLTVSGSGLLTLAAGASNKILTVNGNLSLSGTGGITNDGGTNRFDLLLGGTSKTITNTATNNNFSKTNITVNGTYALASSFDYSTAGSTRKLDGSGTLDISGYTLTMGAAQLSTAAIVTNATSLLKTACTTATTILPITAALTYNGTVEYNSSSAQTIVNATYNNVTLSNSATKSLDGNISVNGGLKISSSSDKLSIGSNTLTLNGTIDGTGSGFIVGSSTSNISVGGTGSLGTLNFDQTTDGTTNILSNFTINRTSLGTLTLGNKLVLMDVLTPTAGVLTTGGYLHLRSTASNTARIAPGPSGGGYISGDVTAERYISASTNRAYRLLAPMVTTTTTINDNWQEGKVNTVVNVNVPSSLAGYGTHITGTTGSADGFDVTQNNQASLYTYTPGVSGNPDEWTVATNTNVSVLNANTGYLLFVRGNRDNINTINTTTGNSNAVLRAKGTLLMGNQTLSSLSSDGNVSLIANPFASPIRWDATSGLYTGTNASNFENYFTVWDPNIGSRGGYVTMNSSGTPGGGATNITRDIQSGQAFFIQTKAGVSSPSFTIAETNKATTNNLDVYRTGAQTEMLKTLLYYTDNTAVVRCADGVTSVFANNYSNGIDGDDAQQIDNWDEDVAIGRGTKLLSIEARDLIDGNDTIPLMIARLKTQAYQWKIVPSDFNAPALEAFLKDNFTNTITALSLSDTTVINFTATTNPASKAANRFTIIFKQNATLPVVISNIKAYTKNSGVQVEWQTSSETNIKLYEVEKSSDAINFSKFAMQTAKGNSTYLSFDATPIAGNNFYRIKIIEQSGKISYSSIVKVAVGKQNSQIVIYPNPVVNNQVGLQLNNAIKGAYQATIFNSLGQKVYSKQLVYDGGSLTTYLHLDPLLVTGLYQIKIEGEGLTLTQSFLKE